MLHVFLLGFWFTLGGLAALVAVLCLLEVLGVIGKYFS